MSWYNPSIAKARQEDTPKNPVILATCQVIVFQGSQADPDFLKWAGEIGRLDIVIDDGSHFNEHVIVSVQNLFPLLADNGIYAIEDLHTAYLPEFGGSHDLDCQSTSIAMCKRSIDGLNWKQIPNHEASNPDQHITVPHCTTIRNSPSSIKASISNAPTVLVPLAQKQVPGAHPLLGSPRTAVCHRIRGDPSGFPQGWADMAGVCGGEKKPRAASRIARFWIHGGESRKLQ